MVDGVETFGALDDTSTLFVRTDDGTMHNPPSWEVELAISTRGARRIKALESELDECRRRMAEIATLATS
jgi:hypothetical protein